MEAGTALIYPVAALLFGAFAGALGRTHAMAAAALGAGAATAWQLKLGAPLEIAWIFAAWNLPFYALAAFCTALMRGRS